MELRRRETIDLDVVVPTFRLDVAKLCSIVNLPVPPEMKVNYFIVVDNPGSELTYSVLKLARKNVVVIVNERNIGGHLSRNKGFEAGNGEFVLFLDDDVDPSPELLLAYAQAIEGDSSAAGFVGVATFPTPVNPTTRGILASDILTFWDIARTRPSLPWGVTANLLVRRNAVGDIRFSSRFPKGGGGEDIDYCLKIVRKNNKWFTSAPRAVVTHGWWGGGSRQFRRFARWSYGDSRLATIHPPYRFRNAPNLAESLLLGLLILGCMSLVGLSPLWKVGAWVAGAFLVETTTEALRLKIRWRTIPFRASLEATMVRLSNDLGRVLGHVRHRHLLGITERFDYFLTGESIAYERKVAVAKFVTFVLAGFAVVFFV